MPLRARTAARAPPARADPEAPMHTALLTIIRNDAACRGALLCATGFIALGALLVLPGPAWSGAAALGAGADAMGRNAVALGLLVAALTGLTVCLRAGLIARLLAEGERVPGTLTAVRPVRRLGRRHDIVVEFRYEVDRQRLHGTTLARSGRLADAARGGPGAAVTVCYDPARPHEAVLAELYEAE